VTGTDEGTRQILLRRGFALEWVTLGWNVAGIIVLAFAAVAARSVGLWQADPAAGVRAGVLRGPRGPRDLHQPL